MKKAFFFLLAILSLNVNAQNRYQLNKLWQTDSILAIPESVLPDLDKKVLYISLIDGAPWEIDGKGGVAKLSLEGKVVDANWITGLNAPKGMGLYKNKLYIADMAQVVIADSKTGKIESKLDVAGAEGLNDVSINDKGIVFVTDSKNGKVFKVEDGKASVHLENIEGINGIKVIKNELYVLGGPVLYKVKADKSLVKVADGFLQGGDGLEPLKAGGFIVSCWGGLIYFVDAQGKSELLLDTREEKINTADIGYNPNGNIIYVPTFFKKSVIAYSIK